MRETRETSTCARLQRALCEVQRQREHFGHALGLQLRSELHLTQCFSIVGCAERVRTFRRMTMCFFVTNFHLSCEHAFRKVLSEPLHRAYLLACALLSLRARGSCKREWADPCGSASPRASPQDRAAPAAERRGGGAGALHPRARGVRRAAAQTGAPRGCRRNSLCQPLLCFGGCERSVCPQVKTRGRRVALPVYLAAQLS